MKLFGFKNFNTRANFRKIVEQLSAKKILEETGSEKKILTHLQLHMIAASYNLEIRHYSEFQGAMPDNKIFSLPPLRNTHKFYVIWDTFLAGWKTDALNKAKHGLYYTEEEKHQILSHMRGLDESIRILFREVPAVLILAPPRLFSKRRTARELDPILIEMIGEDSYEVHTFWNAPHGIAAHLADATHN